MLVLWHIVLLALAAVLAVAGGLDAAAFAAGGTAIACLAGRGAGGRVRAIAFLGAVVVVVLAGLAFEHLGGIVLIYAALLAVQVGALGAAVAGVNESEGEAGPLWSTLAFYAALVAAFLFLSGGGGDLMSALAGASACVGAGLMEWRAVRVAKRFRETGAEAPKGWRSLLAAGFGFAILIAALFGLFAKPLPSVAEEAVKIGGDAREFGASLVAKWKGNDDEPERETGSELGEGEDGPELDFGRRRDLPERAELEQSGEALVHVQIDDRAVFEDFVSSRSYVRSWVLERYAGDAWDEPDSEGMYLDDGADGEEDGWVSVALDVPGGIPHRVFLPNAGGAGLPAIHNPLRYGLSFVVETAPDMFEAELRGSVFYDAVSAPKRFAELDPAKVRAGRVARAHLMEGGGVRLRGLGRQLFGTGRGEGMQLVAIREFLAVNCRYSTRIDNPSDLPPVENFLFGERVGWCDFFATAAVLLAREAGFPARMAYGFSGGQAFADERVVSYRESDAHAWAEVFVRGEGWVVFDTTPPGEGAARVPAMGGAGQAPELGVYRSAEKDDLGAPAERARRAGLTSWVVPVLAGIAALLVIAIAWRLFQKRDEQEGDVGGADESAADPTAPGYWKEFLRLCAEVGRPKPRGETLRETLGHLDELGLAGGVLPELQSYHYAVRYETAPRDKGREGELRRAVKALRKGLD